LEGTYQITAKATDNSNQTVSSEPVTVTVRAEGGKLIYLEDFNDGLAQNWAPSSGTWAVTDSQYFHSSANGVFNCIYNGSTFSDFTFSAKIKSEWDNNFGLIFNYQNEQNYYLVELDASPSTASLKRIKGGAESTLKQTTYNGSGGKRFLFG
jgi:spore coat protein CotH